MAQSATLFQLGMDLGCAPRKAQAEVNSNEANTVSPGHRPAGEERLDHFVKRDGRIFAGTHLIVDLWEAGRLDDLDHVEKTLMSAVEASGATLLHIHLHYFTPNGGISGVAVLAESHISIHTWPERGYAALDIFMCGDAEPHKAIPVLEQAFDPGSVTVDEILRGEVANGEAP
ncbi:MAG TPA: adenosylmethionine decarboxylase [Arenibaculum sp.]|nr:adenosylmethionine decarboxylase [Arenibaculum sp.]